MGEDDCSLADSSFGHLSGLDAIDAAGAVLREVTANEEAKLAISGHLPDVGQQLGIAHRVARDAGLVLIPDPGEGRIFGIAATAFERAVVIAVVRWRRDVRHVSKLFVSGVRSWNKTVVSHKKSPPLLGGAKCLRW